MIGVVRFLLVAVALTSAPLAAQEDHRILFIGNSFTQGANSAVLRYRPDSVDDLNGEGVGGIPALFAKFAEQADLDWEVSHELQGGTTLGFHLRERRKLIDHAWDVVVMQEYSVLNPENPGNATDTGRDASALAKMFETANPNARVYLMSTWSRADQTYKPEGHWYGQTVGQMAIDLRGAMDRIDNQAEQIDGVIPVGEAWNRAIAAGIADDNPYDGRDYGKVDLWSYDHYHASAEGSYLEALVVFATITGFDVREFGANERAAHELGIEPKVAAGLQSLAMEQVELEAAR